MLASDGVFVVSFFALVLLGLWLISGGPMRRRNQEASPLHATGDRRASSGLGRLFGAIGLGVLWVLSGTLSLLTRSLRRSISERRARRVAKGGPSKNKH